MSNAEEWKEYQLEQLEHFRGLSFRFSKYAPPNQKWDHDHCEGCMAKFAEYDWPDVLHEGYVVALPAVQGPEPEFISRRKAEGTLVSMPTKEGLSLHWICPRCFEEFKDLLEWSVKQG